MIHFTNSNKLSNHRSSLWEKSWGNTIVCRFFQAIYPIHRGNMEQILIAYGLLRETVTAIMMLYRNTKVKLQSPDGDTDFFNIFPGVLQGYILAPCLFIIYLGCLHWTSVGLIKENGSKLKKTKKQMISLRNSCGYRLFSWHSASWKYTSIAWSRQQRTLVSIWTQTKQSRCVFIKKESSLLQMAVLWNQ